MTPNPRISCVNHATVDLGVNFNALILALNKFVNTEFAQIWGTPAELVVAQSIQPNEWGMVFLDDADQAGALAYHDVTPDGLPLSKVFVKTTLAAGEQVSVSASHELFEMALDPAINLCATKGNVFYAYETCDPVEETNFVYEGITLSNFVYPSWFEDFHKAGSTQFDYLKKLNAPFELLPGGYAIIFKRGKWKEIFGSQEKAQRFAKEDRRGHRSTQRGKGKDA